MILHELGFHKSAGLSDFARKATGYHDTQRLADISGIDKDYIDARYHKLMMPNTLLYSYEDATKDFKTLHSKEMPYRNLVIGLTKTKQGSPEEKAYLAKHLKALDAGKADLAATYKDITSRYHKIKNP